LGTLLVRQLSEAGFPVRVLTREADRTGHLSAGERGAGHVEVVTGDVRDRGTLYSAFAGVDTVVSAVQGFAGKDGVSPASVDRDGNVNLIGAARDAGADMVLMSVIGAAADSPMELFRMKYAAEERLRASGIPFTIVRAAAFLELWIDLMRDTAKRSGRPLVFGSGNNPINFVSVIDVAAVVSQVVADRSKRGVSLEIAGPENLTFNELAGLVQRSAGRTAAPRHVPRPMLRGAAQTVGRFKPAFGRQVRAALVMDSADFAFDQAATTEAYTDLPKTTAASLLGI
jgi:uncharacterized protein YbjT (DUF2867 family)